MTSANKRTHPIWTGVKAAIGVPALGLFAALFGYGSMNFSIGIDFSIMLAAVALIWSMPALMTFTELVSLGAGASTMFIAITAANLRNVPMVVTALPLVRAEQSIGWNDLVFAQLLSPTGWVHVLLHASNLPLTARRAFFTAFSLTIFASALAGACVGYFFTGDLPPALAKSLLILTPLYLLLILVSVRKMSGYLALGLGTIVVAWLMQWSVEWGLAIGGIGAGTLGFLLGGGWKRKTTS